MCDGCGQVVLGAVPLGDNLIEGLTQEEGTEDGITIYQ
jgi:hypothetical protein